MEKGFIVLKKFLNTINTNICGSKRQVRKKEGVVYSKVTGIKNVNFHI